MNWPECSKFPRFVPSYFKNFERENFSDEKTPVFRGFSKRLKIREITTFLKNFGPNGSKKSTTFENLALTFENLACLQKRLRRQKRGKKAAQNEEFVQKKGGREHFLRLVAARKMSRNTSFSLQNANFSCTFQCSKFPLLLRFFYIVFCSLFRTSGYAESTSVRKSKLKKQVFFFAFCSLIRTFAATSRDATM